jgi:hypothetical protein
VQPGRRGGAPRITTFNFKVDGSKLIGDITSPSLGGAPSTATPIVDGKIDGKNISFSVSQATPKGTIKSDYKGTINGKAIELETTSPGQNGTPMPIKMTLKRATTVSFTPAPAVAPHFQARAFGRVPQACEPGC